MQFLKWNSIKNVRKPSDVASTDYEKAQHLDYWVVTEKVDGANIGLNFDKDGNFLISSRTQLLGPGAEFYDINNQLPAICDLICGFRSLARTGIFGDQITLHGEYFGSKVMNRIRYGIKYGFRFFGISTYSEGTGRVNHSFETFQEMMSEYREFIVPVLGIYKTFEEAVSHPDTAITRCGAGLVQDSMEGIIIQPYYMYPVNNEGNFRFKKKNPAFEEKHGYNTPLNNAAVNVQPSDLAKARVEFTKYCTANRMHTVFSKLGIPTDGPGKHLHTFISDAWEDCVADNPSFKDFTKSERKYVTNIGSASYNLLQEVLSEYETH